MENHFYPEKLIDLESKHLSLVLPILLKDRTTGRNIIWATDSYASKGTRYGARQEITLSSLNGLNSIDIQPRVLKSLEIQKKRTKSKAEVFTPSWVCCLMNNNCDDMWFDRKNVFNTMDGHTWKATEEKIIFQENIKHKSWQDYVKSTRLEITCGEAPFLVSRYDTTTAEPIEIPERIGMLDRKLRIVSENTSTKEEWFKWTKIAYQSTYGYEWQGDSLLIARANLLLTFTDYYKAKWNTNPDTKDLRTIAHIISWNLWQMDGLKYTVPLGGPEEDVKEQLSFDDLIEESNCSEIPNSSENIEKKEEIYCLIHKRKGNSTTTIRFVDLVGNNGKIRK